MGKLLNDHDNYPGWVHIEMKCQACGEKWVSVHHLWMKKEFLTWCPKCPEKKAVFDNVTQLKRA